MEKKQIDEWLAAFIDDRSARAQAGRQVTFEESDTGTVITVPANRVKLVNDFRLAPAMVQLVGNVPNDEKLRVILGPHPLVLPQTLIGFRTIAVSISEESDPQGMLVSEAGATVDVSTAARVAVEVRSGTVQLADEGAGCTVYLKGGSLTLPARRDQWTTGVNLEYTAGRLGPGECHRLNCVAEVLDLHGVVDTQVFLAGTGYAIKRARSDDKEAVLRVREFEPGGRIAVNNGCGLIVSGPATGIRIGGRGRLTIEGDINVTDLVGTVGELHAKHRAQVDAGNLKVGHLIASPHAQVVGSPLIITSQVTANQTSVFGGIELLPSSESLTVLDGLEKAQRVDLSLGDLFDAAPSRDWAIRNERLVDAGRELVDRRCPDGKRRSDWRMQQLRTRAALCESSFDQWLLRSLHWLGDAIDVRRCFYAWALCVVACTPLLLLAIEGAGPGWAISWDGVGNVLKALMVATLGVFTLVPSRGGVDLPVVAWWALPIKVVLTALLASLVASIVRRARWSPAPYT